MENKKSTTLATIAIITTVAIACLSMLPTMQASALIIHGGHGGGGFHHGGHGFHGGFHHGFNNWGWGFRGGNICFSDAPYWVLANHGCFFNDWF